MSSTPKQRYQVAKRSLWAELWHWLISDPWRKIIALILAVCTWAVLTLNINRTGNHRWGAIDHIPLTFHSPQDSSTSSIYFDLQSVSPREVSLSIAVDAWSETQLTPNDFCIRIQPMRLHFSNDGQRTEPLEATYTLLDTDLIEKPDGVTLRGFTPGKITFKWDYIIGKEVPVNLIVDEHLLPSNLTYSYSGSPKVFVTGPAYLINQIKAIDTAPIHLDQDSTGTLSFKSIPLQLPSEFNALRLYEDSIPVSLEIVDNQSPKSQIFKEIRLNYFPPQDHLVLQDPKPFPHSISVIVSGPTGILNTLSSEQLQAICDLSSYSMPGPYDVPIRIMNLPDGVEVIDMVPQRTLRVVLASFNTP